MYKLLRGLGGRRYLLRDGFNGSAANRRLWAVTDAENRITVSGGKLSVAFSADPADAPSLQSVTSWRRVAGLRFLAEMTTTVTNRRFRAGLSTDLTNHAHSIRFHTDGKLVAGVGGTNVSLPYPYGTTSLVVRIDLKAAGALYYVSSDGGRTWVCIWEDSAVTTSPLPAFLQSDNGNFTSDFARVMLAAIKPPIINLTAPAPTLAYGAEVLANGNMETGDPPSSWTATGATLDGVADERTGGSGVQSIDVARLNDNNPSARQAVTLTAHAWYLLVAWGKVINCTDLSPRAVGAAWLQAAPSTATIWTLLGSSGRCPTASQSIALLTTATLTQSGRFDDVSLKPITLSTALSGGGDPGTRYGVFDAACTVTDRYQAGIMACLDDAATPANYLHAYVDRVDGKAWLLKVVGGTTTELASGAVTYGAAKKVRIVVSPGSSGLSNAQVGLYYDGAIVGAVQTVDLSSGFGTLVRAFRTNEADTVVVTVNA